MAGLWYRAGTVSVTNGSKKVTGFGSQWKTTTYKPDKGHTFWGPDGKAYEIDYVESDTVLYLVMVYAGVTAASQDYSIDITRTSTIPAFSRELSAQLAYAQEQYDSWQNVLTGSGMVTLTAPDGQQVQVPSFSYHAELAAAASRDAGIAEAAATAAMMSAKVYSSSSAGLAATPSGQYFSVLSGDASQYVNLYRNNAGTAVLEKTYPSAESVDDWQRLVPGVFLARPYYEYAGNDFYFKADPVPSLTTALYVRGGYLPPAEFTYEKFKADLIAAGVPAGCEVGVTSPSGVADCIRLGAGAFTVWYIPATKSFILGALAVRHHAVKVLEWDYGVPGSGSEIPKIYFQHAMQETARVDEKASAIADDLSSQIQTDDSELVLQLADVDGNVALTVTDDSIKAKNFSLTREGIKFGDQEFISTSDLAFGIIDDEGFYGLYVDNAGSSNGAGSGSGSIPDNATTFQAHEIAKLNTDGLRSLSVTDGTFNTEVARPVWDYNHFLMYGQSLSTGQEGWPALSKSARHGNLMLGGSPRPLSGSAAEFSPVGGVDVLQPLVAVVQGGGAPLSDAQVAELAVGSQALGEDPLVGMVNFAKLQHNQRLLVSNDTSRVFVASSCGVSGRTIEQLSLGASPDIFQRLVQAAQKVKTIASASGKTYGVVAVVFLQGEYNYDTSYGGDATKDGYKAKLSKLYDDIEAQIKTAISGQKEPPIFITYQTGAQYTRDDNALAIGMAQLELSQERRNWYLASPVYPYTDKGGHMDSNGYRWLSKQFGKVWARVVEQGRSWKPLSPLVAQVRGNEVLVSFHVPSPPLAFDSPYAKSVATAYTNKGFEVLVNGVLAGISSVQIVADTVVRILLTAAAIGTVQVRYAGKTAYQGNGSLRDSDQTVADDVYTYNAGTGQYPEANIPSLVDKPYPLHNWCVAFQITATPT